MNRFSTISVVALLGMVFFLIVYPAFGKPCHASAIKTRYGTITYSERGELQRFNRALYMGRRSSEVRKGDTVEEDVKNKIEFIAEKVMDVLDMYIPDLRFDVVIHGSRDGVSADFKRLYGVDVNYIAFYAPVVNTVFFTARNSNLRVVAHELGHVVAENYFEVSPPPRIHEVIAQYAEKHVSE